jgi:hypothetical protein
MTKRTEETEERPEQSINLVPRLRFAVLRAYPKTWDTDWHRRTRTNTDLVFG